MTIEDAFNEFEKVLDEHFNAMNINDNNGKSPSGGFLLPTPCSSSDDDSERTTTRNELVVAYPPSNSEPSKLVVAYYPPLKIPSRPNLAIPLFLDPADGGVLPRLQEIRTWQARPAEHLEVTIPEVDPAYPHFKADVDATATAAATKAAPKASRKKATTKN